MERESRYLIIMKKDTYNVFNFCTNNIRKVYFGVHIGPWVEGDKKLIYCNYMRVF
jgi:hypothetical protein